ncbi:MAG: anaerobic glycerol-3-phosphate dehydrogenase subunit B [Mailhella sp.]|nr:anaerobic glycerol-3-phosphate dehydrogenase subunit B [Mailhella sp.]
MSGKTDFLVVGAGLAGLSAALFAAKAGKSVRIACSGQGSLTIADSSFDLLGYVPGYPHAVREPFEHFEMLPSEHPYARCGKQTAANAITAFRQLLEESGYPYRFFGTDSAPRNEMLLTSLGTEKPSSGAECSQIVPDMADIRRIMVIGMECLKDFFPQLCVSGLKLKPRFSKIPIVSSVMPSPAYFAPFVASHGLTHRTRDVSFLDAARFFETDDGCEILMRSVEDCLRSAGYPAQEDTLVLLPPILGIERGLAGTLRDRLGISVTELVTPGLSVTGYRLRLRLMRLLDAYGVDLFENTLITGHADGPDGRLSALRSDDIQLTADDFVIATGGIYGGGLVVGPDAVRDAIFGDAFGFTNPCLPVDETWSDTEAFPKMSDGRVHAFALSGVRTDAQLRPVDANGKCPYPNVRYAGRSVGGFDPIGEKSGNGSAVITAFAAVESLLANACDGVRS